MRIVLGVGGGIAAYKVCICSCRLFTEAGHDVTGHSHARRPPASSASPRRIADPSSGMDRQAGVPSDRRAQPGDPTRLQELDHECLRQAEELNRRYGNEGYKPS